MTTVTAVLQDWTFREAGQDDWLPAQVPGCVHTDLRKNGRIPEPFYGLNESELQWIDKRDWEYRTEFQVEASQLAGGLELVFDGLDTYADVWLNGELLLQADNMFRTWRVDVKGSAAVGVNELLIRFRSPINEDLPKLEQLGYPLPATNDQSEHGGLGDKKVSIFARKAPYHYGWDWGPRLVTSGIWREARLEAWSGFRLLDLFIRQDKVTAARAKLTAVVVVESDTERSSCLKVDAAGQEWRRTVQLDAGRQTVELPLELEQPELWWCRGLGEAKLYTFTAELLADDVEKVSRQVRTGLRDVRLVQEQDPFGASFYVELNGVPVYAKGANHIPNDSFVTEVTEDRYRYEVLSAVESNMNMLRVWGGGIYEADVFYDLCDEYGLLVWQDFMFACSMYPGDVPFLENVRQEARDNVVRLRNHPSIVLWCGNNEIDSAWAHYDENAGWGWKQQYTPELREKLWADYEAIFHRMLPESLAEHAPGAAYWPSSPVVSLSGTKAQHANPDTAQGDIHYWGVWHMGDPFEDYNRHIGRFMSEYGFQSFPELRSVLRYAKEEDLELESDVMTAHQRNNAGNRIIKKYMDVYMKEPKDFPAFLHLSQVLQAEAMKTAIEAHRRRKPYCMGTLYWQMNDCWPVASWAGIDYYGAWKVLQYAARRSFADVLLTVDGSVGGFVQVHLVSDRNAPVRGTLKLELLRFDGTVLWSDESAVALAAQTASCVASLTKSRLLAGYDMAELPELVLSARLVGDDAVLGETEFYFAYTKDLRLTAPGLKLTEVPGSGGALWEVQTDVLAQKVWLSAEQEGVFSDNGFDLLPGQVKRVAFRTMQGGVFQPAAAGSVTVTSLWDCI